jgi:predicted transcriptional regulator
MPYERFLAAAKATRYDVELLGHRFRTSFEQVCHRLSTLQRPGSEGVPFHFLKIDTAGNISKRFSASGIRFARFGGACPRWNVARAFMSSHDLRIQISRMPAGETYFCVAKVVRRRHGGYRAAETVHAVGLGCRLTDARQLVYADGFDLEAFDDQVVPIGVTCRLCERRDCDQRAFPSLQQPLKLDENVRGVGFYSTVDER